MCKWSALFTQWGNMDMVLWEFVFGYGWRERLLSMTHTTRLHKSNNTKPNLPRTVTSRHKVMKDLNNFNTSLSASLWNARHVLTNAIAPHQSWKHEETILLCPVTVDNNLQTIIIPLFIHNISPTQRYSKSLKCHLLTKTADLWVMKLVGAAVCACVLPARARAR